MKPSRSPIHLKRNYRYILAVTALPEFQAYMTQLETDHFSALDRRIKNTLGLDALIRQLRHKDWRARDAAVETVLRLHNRAIDRIDIRAR